MAPTSSTRPSASSIVVVHGASGFLGQALVRRLKRDFRVVPLDVSPHPPASVAQALREVRRKSEGSELRAFVDLAAADGSTNGSLVASPAFFDAWRGHPPFRILYAGHLAEPSDEAQRFPRIRLEFGVTYDEHARSLAIAREFARVARNPQAPFHSASDYPRHFLHLEDLAEAIARLIARDAAFGEHEQLRIGEEEPMTWRELTDQIGRALHGRRWHQVVPLPRLGSAANANVNSNEPAISDSRLELQRAFHLLGWHPRHRIREVLPAIAAFFRDDEAAFYRVNRLAPPSLSSLPTRRLAFLPLLLLGTASWVAYEWLRSGATPGRRGRLRLLN